MYEFSCQPKYTPFPSTHTCRDKICCSSFVRSGTIIVNFFPFVSVKLFVWIGTAKFLCLLLQCIVVIKTDSVARNKSDI